MKRSAKGDEVSRVRRPSGPAGRVDCQNRLDQTMGNHGRTPKWRLRSSRLAPCTRPTVGSRGIVRWTPDNVRILEGGKPAHFREVPAGCFETRPEDGSAFASLQDPPAAVHAAWTDSPQEGVPFGSVGAGLFPGPLGSTPFHRPRDQIGAQQGVVRHRARLSQGSSVTGLVCHRARLSRGLPPVRGCTPLVLDPRIGRRPHPSLPTGGPARRSCQGVSGKSPKTGPRRTVSGAVKLISALDRLY